MQTLYLLSFTKQIISKEKTMMCTSTVKYFSEDLPKTSILVTVAKCTE